MCGIVGFTGNNNAVNVLLEELKRLEYRGYDSAGIAIKSGEEAPVVVKTIGSIASLEKKISSLPSLNGSIGIGHTRWATHGKPTESNAHPHYSEDFSVVGVHNGIIENYLDLKEELIENGYSFYGQTDTEVLIKLIDYFYKNDGTSPLIALTKALKKAKGSYALGLIFKGDSNRIYFAKNGSPLIIGKGKDAFYLASDASALAPFCENVIYLCEGEYGYIEPSKAVIFDNEGNKITDLKALEAIQFGEEPSSKGDYPHCMLKEIFEEPYSVKETISKYVQGEEINFSSPLLSESELSNYESLLIVACGSSFHVGLVAQYVIESLTRIPVRVEYSSEFKYRPLPKFKNCLGIFISQSGETKDTIEALEKAKFNGIQCISIVNVHNSTLARSADGVVYTYAGSEVAVATTKAYACQLVLIYLLSLKLALANGLDKKKYSNYLKQIHAIPALIESILKDASKIEEIAKSIANYKDVYFIGRGIDYATSMEGSLKLKEVSYIHSESTPGGELKHGTLALIDSSSLVVSLLNDKDLKEKALSNTIEVTSRGGHVIALAPASFKLDPKLVDHLITLPDIDSHFTSSLAIVPLQLLAYYVSISKSLDPDKPRNLAKSVTVE